MDEKFLVRMDEEYPSDEKMDVRLVEAQEVNDDHKKRLDAILAKIDKIASIDPNTEVLADLKDVMVEINATLKNTGGFNETLDRMESKIDASGTKIENAIGPKFYELNDNIQDIRDKINKRNDNEAKEMMLALSDKMDRITTDDIKEMVGDLTIHVENLAQRYEVLSQKAGEDRSDGDVMGKHIVAELDNIKGVIAGIKTSAISEQKIKSMVNAVNRANASQQKVERIVKDFNAYLVRLNSIDYMLRLLAAKNLLKSRKKLPKWAGEKKKVLERLIAGLETEVVDILIVNAVPKTGITVLDLSRAIARTSRKTQDRLKQLIAGGFVEERLIKRRKVYFLVE